jgi:hypothetical protein
MTGTPMIDKLTETFLRAVAGGVKHSGRTLFDHLVGTHALLEKQRAPEYVCLAGLFHSIYGTNAFRHATVPIKGRGLVKILIGEPAERLAYIFCSCDRPPAFVDAVRRGPPYQVTDRRKGEVISLSDEDMYDLLLIEVANLEDQVVSPQDVRAALDLLLSSILLDIPEFSLGRE